ncbi:bifunctional phosphoribosylaminoimidazolecarboxamide formyltransferase/IMP cyclohydrolase [Candidatus Woesearchaeota archaeon]|nr:bifunctional phosphoribosylaminoimidazolecarboxamide formyltransferase/IMP cyclohydrolase [Candidatus Woesearchaeota archaeon]
MIKRALVSVSNKEGIVAFVSQLVSLGVEIVSTGGTAALLKKHKLPVVDVASYTQFPEMLDGRVKTLHPKVFAGILAQRANNDHLKQMETAKIPFIDMVVVNLYPFEETIAHAKVTEAEAIEQIDVGGPSLLRAAAKNYADVIVVCDPSDYTMITDALRNGNVPQEMRRQLAFKVFQRVSLYDAAISTYLQQMCGQSSHDKQSCQPSQNNENKEIFPSMLDLHFSLVQHLRYGENPYQQGAFYREQNIPEPCIANAKQLHGKGLSYNNILDANDAIELIKEFTAPTAAVLKHTNPCGVASATSIEQAIHLAMGSDSMSAFGGVVILNRNCTKAVAEYLKPLFLEIIICPAFQKDALAILQEKKNIRLLETGKLVRTTAGFDMKKVLGGILIQTRTFPKLTKEGLRVVTKQKPNDAQSKAMMFAWSVCKQVKSNAIVYAQMLKDGELQTTGIGAGQMSRVDAVKIASFKAGDLARSSVMASDAFFPFRDGLDEAAKAGIKAIIQPGGSIRDQEVIDAADEHGMVMVFTGFRTFKH